MMQRPLFFLTLPVLVSSFAASCGGGSTCEEGAVDVQAFNNTPMNLTMSGARLDSSCAATETVPAQNLMPTYFFSDDLEAGQVIRYRITGGATVDCTVDQEGVDITYVRAEMSFDQILSCSCGFAEFYDADPGNRGSCI